MTQQLARATRLAPTAAQAATQDAFDERDDRELLERLRAGHDRAFDELVGLAAGRMLAVARRMLGREEEAEDAVQEAFLSAFKSLDRFDGRSRLTTWLHRITVNACLMRLRAQRRRPERPLSGLLPRFREDGHQDKPTRPWKPLESAGIESAEVRDLVCQKVEGLPEQYRLVLLLRDIAELDTEETASVLGVTTAAVKTRLHRARQALRTLLEPYYSEDAA